MTVFDSTAPARAAKRLLGSAVVPLSLALGGVAWGMASLAPGGDVPAWPAVSLGVVALAVSFRRGPALPRAFASLLGSAAIVAGGAQIAVLWAAARAAESYM